MIELCGINVKRAFTIVFAVGLLQAFGNYFRMSFSSMLVFRLMIVVLLIRPHRLMRDPEASHT